MLVFYGQNTDRGPKVWLRIERERERERASLLLAERPEGIVKSKGTSMTYARLSERARHWLRALLT